MYSIWMRDSITTSLATKFKCTPQTFTTTMKARLAKFTKFKAFKRRFPFLQFFINPSSNHALLSLPAISIGKGDDVVFIVVQQGYHPLTDVVHTDRQSEELGLGPYITIQTYSLLGVLGIESWNCKSHQQLLKQSKHHWYSITSGLRPPTVKVKVVLILRRS